MIPVIGACSSSSYGGKAPSGGPDAGTCNGVDATSSVAEAHDHMVCVASSDLTNPPAAGVTYTTTTASGHTHTVTLTQAQLGAIEGGGTVMVTTSSTVDPINGASHVHQFAIKLA